MENRPFLEMRGGLLYFFKKAGQLLAAGRLYLLKKADNRPHSTGMDDAIPEFQIAALPSAIRLARLL